MPVVLCSSSERLLEVKLSRGCIFGFSCAFCSELFKGTGDLTGKRDIGTVEFSGEEELNGSSSFELKEDFVLSLVIACSSKACSRTVLVGTELRRLRGCGS